MTARARIKALRYRRKRHEGDVPRRRRRLLDELAQVTVIGDAPGGVYLPKVLKLVTETAVKPAGVAVVNVFHDDGCGIFHGHPCDCDPDVRLSWRSRQFGGSQ